MRNAQVPMFGKSIFYLLLLLLAAFLILFAMKQGSLQWLVNSTVSNSTFG